MDNEEKPLARFGLLRLVVGVPSSGEECAEADQMPLGDIGDVGEEGDPARRLRAEVGLGEKNDGAKEVEAVVGPGLGTAAGYAYPKLLMADATRDARCEALSILCGHGRVRDKK
jgi:hypothetical protein